MSTEITINQDIVEINVTEQVVTIEAPSGAYPLPNLVSSVFGRTGNVVAQEGDYTLTQLGGVTITSPTNNQVLKYNGTAWVNSSDTDTGLTSVGLSMPSAFSVANSPLTANGTLSVTGAGNATQYVRGDGALATLPTNGGGGASVSYYLNGSVNQGTIGGVTYYEMNRTPIIGAGTDFSRNSNGYIASFLTDANDPALLNIPAGNWNFETYFNASSSGGSPTFYIELYKYDGVVFTLIASNSGSPKLINDGTNIEAYFSALAVPQTTLTLTDRLAIRIYVTTAGRTITLHTENGHLCQVITTFTTGLTALNGLTSQVQYFATGTSGTDFNISSATSTHTFNLPTASATNRGLLSSADWTTFNAKQNALTNPVTGTGTTNTLPKFTGASTIGNSNVIDSGTLITLGSNTTISSGALGIGTTSLTGVNLNIAKNITGATTAWSVLQQSTVQSDANTNVFGFSNILNTQATSFTLTQYIHYNATQGTLGAGSSVGTNVGFNVSPSMIGATTNIAFRGTIPVGTGRWNLYMDGMGANYLAGDTAIGTTTLGTATQLTVGGTETAVSAIGRGQLINTTLVASANSDVLVGLDINPTFTNGAFTGVNNIALKSLGRVHISSNFLSFGSGNSVDMQVAVGSIISWNQNFGIALSGGIIKAQLFNSTGNFTLQNGGTFTDAGFRLDVNGTTRFIGTASSDTAPLGSELAAVTGTGTNWTLAGTNLNVGGYTHTTGSVVPLTTALAAVNGTYYQIAYTITGRTTGSITINYGGTSTSGITATGATGPLASSTAVLTITPTTDFNGTVVLSIKTIGTSAASSTFANSASTINLELRASNLTSNTFIGRNSGRRDTTGTDNTFVGSNAGANNTTGNLNIFIGNVAGFNNTIGSNNTFLGTSSGQSNTSGSNNTFIGLQSGLNNTTGTENTFLGRGTGQANTVGSSNTFIGLSTGANNIGGNINTYVGIYAGSVSNGSNNVYLGGLAAFNSTSGDSNVIIGANAGRFIANGSTSATIFNNSILIGNSSKPLGDNQNNQIVIGQGTIGLGSNTTVIGNSSTTLTALYGDLLLGTTTPSTATMLTVSGTETASSAIARGGLINTALVASANGDTTIGLDINPTFTNGSFTGVNNFGLRVGGTSAFKYGASNFLYFGSPSNGYQVISANRNPDTGIHADTTRASAEIIIATNTSALGGSSIIFSTSTSVNSQAGNKLTLFGTGNLLLQNGGTFTDAGFRLDVQGTARVTSDATINGLTVGKGAGNVASNTAIGASALENNTTATQNTALGGIALRNTTTGGFNTAIGYNALVNNFTGSENTAIGRNAGQENTSISNVYIGTNSGLNQTSGANNVFLGHDSGRYIADGSTANAISTASIFIGQGSKAAANNQTNQIVIGRNTTGLGTNTTIIGTTTTTITGLYGNIRLVSGMGTAPASATATGTTGDIVVTAGFIYVCTATNTWVRTALTTW
jgi:hypothetical protein